MEPIVKTAPLTIGSPEFRHKGIIPVKYTCEGENVNPPVTIENIPADTKSLTLIMDDPDAPAGTFDHWVTWNIRPVKKIFENTVPGVEGMNSFGQTKYQGPCPPSGTHRYFIKLYALDTLLNIPAGSDKRTVEKAMKDHIIAEGQLICQYKKST